MTFSVIMITIKARYTVMVDDEGSLVCDFDSWVATKARYPTHRWQCLWNIDFDIGQQT